MKLPTLETPRLLLRPLELADAEAAQHLFAHWEIVRHLNAVVPWPYPGDGCHIFYRDVCLPEMERGDAWHWSLRLRNDPSIFIGAISLYRLAGNNRGFWVGLPWQGQGYMSEASEAATDYWFDVLQFPLLEVPKAIDNKGSRRISEKTGMRVVRTEERAFVEGRMPAEIWQITAEEWRVRRGAPTK
ncbi:GNAT family N-acetyltransferase [Lacibacterium aquatile]|uniref:GNAT family N-acetyltransferase n=1 Tax=Lacibacterium aquatile TaxID=1168082 RepID=A0ABW5DVN6_9PROT